MNLREHLIQTLQEECAEIIQAASKINRFGERETYPDGIGKIQKLEQEFNDFLAVVEMLRDNTSIRVYENPEMIALKKTKIVNHFIIARLNRALDDTQ